MTGIIQEMRLVVNSIVGDEEKASDVVYALIKRFGGDRLYVPTNDFEMRNREIKLLYKNDVPIKILAQRFKLSVRTVSRIVKEGRSET